jgi:hypothetical protein
MPPA